MTKGEIQQLLRDNHLRFTKQIQDLSDSDFLYSYEHKWSAGQQLDHIIKSITPVNTAFKLPVLMLRTLFGKANRPSKNYKSLEEKYMLKLEAGGKATARFIPPPIPLNEREQLINRLLRLVESLIARVNYFSEVQLDRYILPHPLLGKLTLREMLYFTIYHVAHHHDQIRKNLEKRSVTP